MVLTPRQKEELKSAVASFLKEIGADEARKIFIQESNVKNVNTDVVLMQYRRQISHFRWTIRNTTVC